LVYQGSLTIGNLSTFTLNPWATYFSDPRVFARVKNFRNLRCDLRIKIVINGNPFYYGLFLASYIPMHGNDSRTDLNVTGLIQASQCPHIYIDPCTSTAGELCVPYFFPKDAMNVPDKEWSEMGLLSFHTISALEHANDGTEPINMSVFVSAFNVQLSTPTINEPVENQSEEYLKPSFIAHSVAWASGYMKNFPIIGPYMRATEMVSTAIGDVAAMFGFSRPREIRESSNFRNRPVANLAVTNVPDNVASLALDAKKEVTIDPRVVGLEPKDEMVLTPIAMKESYITKFPWSETIDGPNTHLFSIRVNPIQGNTLEGGNIFQLTPSAFTTLPFRYWRGSMRFRFNVIASAYHRGRLKLVWDPDFSPDSAGDIYNTNYTTIVDISNDKEVTMDVGWGSNYSYLRAGGLRLPKFSTSAFTEKDDFCNGTLSVYVVNGLTSPGVNSSDVEVAVFASMLEDYEVACPEGSLFHSDVRLRIHELPETDYDPQPTNDPIPTYPGVQPPTAVIAPTGVGYGPRNAAFSTIPSAYKILSDFSIRAPSDGVVHILTPTPNTATIGGSITLLDIPNTTFTTIIDIRNSANDATIDSFTYNGTFGADGTAVVNFSGLTKPTSSVFYFKMTAPASHKLINYTIDGIVQKKYLAEDLTPSLGSYNPTTEVIDFTFTDIGDVLTLPLEEDWNTGAVVHLGLIGTNGRVFYLTGGNSYSIVYANVTGELTPCGAREASTASSNFEIWPYNSTVLNDPYQLTGLIFMAPVENQSEEIPKVDTSVEPTASSSQVQMAPKLPGAETNQVYFGEHVTSWRQVLKRYETIMTFNSFDVNMRWYDAINELSPSPPLDANGMTLVDYVRSAYVGYRGSMRIRFLIRPLNNNFVHASGMISNISDAERITGILETEPSFSGSSWEYIPLTGSLDAEVPYYSNLRFFPGRLTGAWNGQVPEVARGRQRLEANVQIRLSDEAHVTGMQAVGEDFSLHFFLCAPQLEYFPT